MAVGLNLMKDVGIGTLVVMAGGLTVLGVAGALIGSPLMLSGAVGIAALGAPIIPFALAMNIMKDVGIETVGVMAAGLVTLGLAAAGLGLALILLYTSRFSSHWSIRSCINTIWYWCERCCKCINVSLQKVCPIRYKLNLMLVRPHY